MPDATIDADDPGNPDPNPVKCKNNDQKITWKLNPNAEAFDPEPIRFPPPPNGYDRWPGGPVTVKNNKATADVNKVIGAGPKQRYKYTVVLANGTEFDPDIENIGVGGDEDDEKTHRRPGS